MKFTKAQLQQLYEQYAPLVHRRAMSILHDRNEAWDAVQATFERLMKQGSFAGDAQPITYIYRTATNVCLNVLRAKGTHEAALARDSGQSLAVAPEPAADARSLLRALAEELDETELLIAALHFSDDLPQEQIAEIVQLSRKTVGKKLERVLAAAAAVRAREQRERDAG